MGIQIYDQISIPRNWSKVKLTHAVSIELGLNEVKIAQNIVKVGMHAYLSNADPNLWSNLNFEKLFKRENALCIFTKVGIKGGQSSS